VIELRRIVLLLGAASVALAQSQTSASTQSDSFHVRNCATPCVAELVLTQAPSAPPALYVNGVPVSADLSLLSTPSGDVAIIVSFSPSTPIQDTDEIVVTYAVVPSSSTP
jgi:hypothetical protein